MSRIYEALKDAQASVRRNGVVNSLVRSQPLKQSSFECHSIENRIRVRVLDDELVSLKRNSAVGILLGTSDEGIESTLTVECHARIPGSQKRSFSDDLFHLNAFVDRWTLNPARSLDIVGLYRFADQNEDGLTHQDLTALKAVERGSPLIFLLGKAGDSGSRLHLFAVRGADVVESWTLPGGGERSLSKRNQDSLTEADKPHLLLAPASSAISSPEKTLQTRVGPYSIGVFAFVALLVLGFFATTITRHLSTSVNDQNVGLQLAREGTVWRLSWDPDSPVFRHATIARLSIIDGNLEKTLELDNADLKGGEIVYSAATNDLLFRLQVERSDSRKPIVQSVRAVARLTAPTSSSAIVTVEPEITVRPASFPSPMINTVVPEPLTNTSSIKGSRPDSWLGRSPLLAPSTAHAEVPIPILQNSSSSSPANPLDAILSEGRLRTPPPPAELPGRRFEPAQLIARRDPIYPDVGIDLEGAVKLDFVITSTGMVRDIKITSGNPVLGAAAKAAVEKWRYSPARQSGSPIQTDGTAVITFNRHPAAH